MLVGFASRPRTGTLLHERTQLFPMAHPRKIIATSSTMHEGSYSGNPARTCLQRTWRSCFEAATLNLEVSLASFSVRETRPQDVAPRYCKPPERLFQQS